MTDAATRTSAMHTQNGTQTPGLASRLFTALIAILLLVLANAQTAQARFLSPDPWDPWLQGVDINRYAYANNDPVNLSDPNGHYIDQFGTWNGGDEEIPGFDYNVREHPYLTGAMMGAALGPAALGAAEGLAAAAPVAYETATALAAGEVGLTVPTVSTGLATTTLVAGKMELHHILPKALANSPLIKQLGINLEAMGNKMLALQNGFAQGHKNYNRYAAQRVQDIFGRLRSGVLTPQEAMKELASLRQELRKLIKNDPATLARKKGDPVLSNPITQQSSQQPNGGAGSGGSGGNGKPSPCGAWICP